MRQEQIEDKKRYAESERTMGQLGRQLGEQRSQSDKLHSEKAGIALKLQATQPEFENNLKSLTKCDNFMYVLHFFGFCFLECSRKINKIKTKKNT